VNIAFLEMADGETEKADIVSSLLIILPSQNNSAQISPGTMLLGLPLIRRAVLSADRAGFEKIAVFSADVAETRDCLEGTDAIVLSADQSLPAISAQRIVILGGDILPGRKWLEDLLGKPLEPGRMDFEAETAAVIETFPGQWLMSMTPPPHGADSPLDTEDAFSALAKTFDANPCKLGDAEVLELTPTMSSDKAEDWLLSRLVKETDGLMSRLVSRPISLFLTRRLVRTTISANAMTVLSIFIGLSGAPFFLSTSPGLQLTGALLFLSHSILDGCDGELARLRHEESHWGGVLDFWGDNLVHIAVFSCMAVGWSLHIEAFWPLLAGIAAVAGTAASSGLVYWRTMRYKHTLGPLFTSVATIQGSNITNIADTLARRDFIYLVVFLAAFGKASWFLALTAVGAPIFFLLLVWVAHRESKLKAI